MKEYDIFILKENLNPLLPKGSKGVILMTYPNNFFEVEFVKKDASNVEYDGRSTFTVSGELLEISWVDPTSEK